MRIHLACASNERYAPQAAAMLRSVIATNPPESIAIHYVHGGDLSTATQARLRGMLEAAGAEIEFLAIDPALADGLPILKQLPAVMWYRVFLPGLLPQLSRVLYLDCDMVVTDALKPLYDCDLEGHWLGAVTAPFADALRDWPIKLGLPTTGSYFSSGLLLFDLNALRKSDAERQIFAYGRQQGDALNWPDQDALNVVLHKHRLNLHPRWNFMNGIVRGSGTEDVFLAREIQQAAMHPAIVHFDGQNVGKPWQTGCRHPHRHLYFHHLRHTPWKHDMPARSMREKLREHYLVGRARFTRLLSGQLAGPVPVKSGLALR